jgi:hypoxanthine phosphoribosyltransferase
MISRSILGAVLNDVSLYCRGKGYREVASVNNFVPHDLVASFGMAKMLINDGFDCFLAVAPEGHIYGYFLDRLGVRILSVFVDYPPTKCFSEDNLRSLHGKRVLLIEDDVISGRTLQLIVEHLRQFSPRSLDLYLGHNKGVQHLRNVPPEIGKVYIAEDNLNPNERLKLEREFVGFFNTAK